MTPCTFHEFLETYTYFTESEILGRAGFEPTYVIRTPYDLLRVQLQWLKESKYEVYRPSRHNSLLFFKYDYEAVAFRLACEGMRDD